jgi:hypothetical protein
MDSAADKAGRQRARFCAYVCDTLHEDMQYCRIILGALSFLDFLVVSVYFCRIKQPPHSPLFPVW